MNKIVSLIMSIVMVIGIFCMPTSVNAKNAAINQEKLYVYSFNKELKAYVEFFREKYPDQVQKIKMELQEYMQLKKQM